MKGLFLVYYIFACTFCLAQEKKELQYKFVGESLLETKNKNYLNRALFFLDDKDTVVLNIKIPFDSVKNELQNTGIFYNCHLQEGLIYTFTVRKICLSEIPEGEESYYKSNANFENGSNCSSFSEIQGNTDFKYAGNYGRYVDMGNELYKIENLMPSDSCFFGH